MTVTFRLAGTSDDAAVGALLAQSDLPGWISLSYRPSPGQHGMPHPGAQSETLVGEGPGGLAGMVTRSTYPGMLAGRVQPLTYLGQFRVAPGARRRVKLLQRAFDAYRETFADRLPDWEFASLLDGNGEATRLLTAGLPGFPRFLPLGRFQTLALRARRVRRDPGIRAATAADMVEVADLVSAANVGRPLAPALEAGDIVAGRWPGLQPSDFLVIGAAGGISGVVAVWDQRAFRQTVVTGYRGPMARLRPLANALGVLTGLPRLPPVGQALALAPLTFLATAPGDCGAALRLIRAARGVAAARGLGGVALGLAENDPLLPLVRKTMRSVAYGSCIHAVTWQDRTSFPGVGAFAGMKPEIGLL